MRGIEPVWHPWQGSIAVRLVCVGLGIVAVGCDASESPADAPPSAPAGPCRPDGGARTSPDPSAGLDATGVAWPTRRPTDASPDVPAADGARAGDTGGAMAAATPPASCPAARLPETSFGPLHVADGALRDALGRRVVLRGINLSGMGSGATGLFDATDFARLRAHGLRAARLVLGWKGIEPEPGVIDEAYLDEVVRLARLATAAGIHLWPELHQFFWDHDGMPGWTCDLERELTSEYMMGCAAQFWGSETLQARFAEIWTMLAERLRDVPSVVLFDVLNEPPPPSAEAQLDGSFEQQVLPAFYDRVITAIRSVDPDRVVAVEPSIAALEPSGLGPIPHANLVLAPHVYVLHTYVPGQGLVWLFPPSPELVRMQYAQAEAAAAARGMALVIGEFGVALTAPAAAEPGLAGWLLDAIARQDAGAMGALYWDYAGGGWSMFDADGTLRPFFREHLIRPYLYRFAGDVVHVHATPWSGRLRARVTVPRDAVCVPVEVVLPPVLYPEPPDIVVSPGATYAYDPVGGLLVVQPPPNTRWLDIAIN